MQKKSISKIIFIIINYQKNVGNQLKIQKINLLVISKEISSWKKKNDILLKFNKFIILLKFISIFNFIYIYIYLYFWFFMI